MINWIRNYFEIKKRTAQFVFWSSIVALSSIFVAKIADAAYSEKVNAPKLLAYTPSEENLAQFQKANYTAYKKTEFTKKTQIINHQVFNPNTADKELLMQNGIPEKVAARILKSRNGGYVYRSKDSFSKTYGLTPEIFAALEAYIDIPTVNSKENYKDFIKNETKTPYVKKTIAAFDINTATTDDLQQINGIGPSYAKRILSYRDALGGFYEVHQVSKVYKLPDSIYTKVAPFLYVKQGVRKINVNHSDAENIPWQLLKSNKKAAIIAYRNQHGPYKNMNDLLKVKIITEEDIKILEPYIAF